MKLPQSTPCINCSANSDLHVEARLIKDLEIWIVAPYYICPLCKAEFPTKDTDIITQNQIIQFKNLREEATELKRTINIQSHIVKQRGDDLAEAIIFLVKLVPLAHNRAYATQEDLNILKEVNDFLHREE